MLNVSLADYGVGNLYSLKKAFEKCGAKVEVESDMKKLVDADCIAFPGVGAFDSTVGRIDQYSEGLLQKFSSGTPCLGICIGAQILMEGSEEGVKPGLGFIKGKAKKLSARQIPHVGWNYVKTDDDLFRGIDDRYLYFTHSYFCEPAEKGITVGTTEYEGTEYPVFFRKSNVVATQFHPEKSSNSGLKFIKNFIQFAESVQ